MRVPSNRSAESERSALQGVTLLSGSGKARALPLALRQDSAALMAGMDTKVSVYVQFELLLHVFSTEQRKNLGNIHGKNAWKLEIQKQEEKLFEFMLWRILDSKIHRNIFGCTCVSVNCH